MPASTWSQGRSGGLDAVPSAARGCGLFGRTRQPEESDPQVYLNEAANGVFSLPQREYAPCIVPALSPRLPSEKSTGPATVASGESHPPSATVREARHRRARGGDDLYTTSLMALADSLSDPERARLVQARDAALRAIHEFADWLDRRQGTMPEWEAMGAARYNYLLKHVLLLPYDVLPDSDAR